MTLSWTATITTITTWLAGNFTSWFFQILLIGTVGAALPFLFRIREPRSRLVYMQLLMAVCLVWPLVQPWQDPRVVVERAADQTVSATGPTFVADETASIDWPMVVVWAFGLGGACRLAWIGAGFLTISRYRLRARPMFPLPDAVRTAGERTGTRALFAVSADVSGPVTFGLLSPVILVPPAFEDMDADAQCGIACHELIHVRRHDWLATMAEELYSTLFWFHPAVWWLVSESRLAREQLVDAETVRLTRNAEPYIRALIAVAGNGGRMNLAPATLFLRRRHLARRMQSLLMEVSMSRQRMLVSYGAMLAIVTLAAWSTLISFPIVGQAEIAAPAAIQTPPGTNEEGFVVRRNAIRYPADAVERGVEGEVVVDLTFNADGAIIDSDVISGPEELRQAGLQSALINGYNISTARTLQVIVDFSLNENGEAPRPNRIIEEIQVLDLTDPDLTALRTRLAPYVGRSETDVVAALPDIIAQITPDPWWLSIGSGASGGGLVNIHFSEVRRFVTGSTAGAPPPPPPPPPPASAGERLRVAAGVSQGNLLQQVPPEYPPLAREARIQGLVLLETIIGRDGRVQSARILTGHPLLAPAAADAVLQWVYRPTLLNGQPVEIVTTVSVTFSLN